MSEMNKQQQSGVGSQNSQQQQQQQAQQQVEGQAIQVQISHDGTDQIQGTQVASSNTTLNSTSTMVMAAPQQALISQQAMQNLQSSQTLAPIPSQGGSTTITTMSTGPPQQMTDWPGHGRVQVIQQPLQNPTYIQPVYNAQGQLIVPSNIAVHPGNMNQPIQVIAAGKAFQPNQMSHMLTTAQGKPIVQGQTASFPSYATIPTSGSNQTLVISQLGVLGQTNILPQQQSKPQEIQKMISKTNGSSSSNSNNSSSSSMKSTSTQQQNVSIGNLVSSQTQGITTQAQTIIQPQIISPIQYTCNTQQQRTVPQGTTQAMQFAPWQATFGPTGLPQGLTWAPSAIQSSALLTQGSQIFIRNPQSEQTGMFIHNAQPTTMSQQTQISGTQANKSSQGMDMGTSATGKAGTSKTFSAILPNSVGPQQFRPASSVSTQTGQTQTSMHQTNFRGGSKVRTKNVCRMPTMATIQKADAGNQTKAAAVQVLQQKLVVSNVTPGSPTIVSHDNKLLKQNSSPTQVNGNPNLQQPLAQIQQMQNTFHDSIDQKPQGQIMMSTGITSNGERVMPVVSMSPGQMTSIMGNMILQTVPGIATMAPSITIPAGQSVQSVPIAQEIIATSGAVPLNNAMKQDSPVRKENGVPENNTTGSGPARSADENTSGSEESVAPGTSASEDKEARPEVLESDDIELDKDRDMEDKDGDKKLDKDGMLLSQAKATMMVKPQVLTHVIEGFVIQESSEPFPVNRGMGEGLMRKMPVGEESGEPPVKKLLVDDDSSSDEEDRVDPLKWTVSEVCEFIRNLPGCSDYVEDFALQDIDGEALMLLKPDHLMSAMSMKLGPAVKIIAKIDTMRGNNPGPSKEGGV